MKSLIENKKIIVISLIVIILVIVSVLIIKEINRRARFIPDDKVIDGPIQEEMDYKAEWSGKINDITNLDDYYIVKNCLNKFYLNYYYMYTEENTNNYLSNVVFDLLPNSYITDNEITIDNIKEKLPEIGENEVYITSAYMSSNFEDKNVYVVDYILREVAENKISNMKSIIVCNTKNKSFEIYPNDYIATIELPNYEVGKDFNVEFDVDFEKNNNNGYGAGAKSYNDYANDVFESYRKLMMYDREQAYELLEDGFKSTSYPTFDSFNSFISSNMMDIFLMTFSDYDSSKNDYCYIFTCYDKKDVFYLTFYANSLTNIKYKIEKYR